MVRLPALNEIAPDSYKAPGNHQAPDTHKAPDGYKAPDAYTAPVSYIAPMLCAPSRLTHLLLLRRRANMAHEPTSTFALLETAKSGRFTFYSKIRFLCPLIRGHGHIRGKAVTARCWP